MSPAGDEIVNPVTGERIVFRHTAAETAGELLELDDFWSRRDHRVAEHVHPEMEERWEVIAGTVGFRIDGAVQSAGPGDVVTAAAGVPHMSWNDGGGPAHILIQMRPALRWEEFVRRLFAAARDGRTNQEGTPEPALLVNLLADFRREIAPPS
jgi:quercetin dioxygenase-like cupin family protein